MSVSPCSLESAVTSSDKKRDIEDSYLLARRIHSFENIRKVHYLEGGLKWLD